MGRTGAAAAGDGVGTGVWHRRDVLRISQRGIRGPGEVTRRKPVGWPDIRDGVASVPQTCGKFVPGDGFGGKGAHSSGRLVIGDDPCGFLTTVKAQGTDRLLRYMLGTKSRRREIMARATSRTWALVLNGARCRILRGISHQGEAAPAELVLRSESRKLRDIMSDKPGRSFASKGGGRRSAMEYASDPIAEDQREFVRQVISLLESHRLAGDFDSLAVFAEHEMLGLLRQMMPHTLAGLVIREVPRNLLQFSAQELAEAVSRELQSGPGIS